MTKKLICILLTFSLLLCASCSTAKSDLPGNVSWDMSSDEVRQTVGEERITDGSSAEVLNWLQTKELTDIYGDRTVSVAYIFVDNALRSITVQVLVNEGETIQQAKDATCAAMENSLGSATEADKTIQWQSDTATVKLMDVEGAESFFVIAYSPLNK